MEAEPVAAFGGKELYHIFYYYYYYFLPFPACGIQPGAPAALSPGGCGAWVASGAPGAPPAPAQVLGVGFSPGAKPGEETTGDSPKAENESQPLHGSGICKWFNVRMGFGFLSMTAKGGATLDSPVDVFVHQVRGGEPGPGVGSKRGAAPTPRRGDAVQD